MFYLHVHKFHECFLVSENTCSSHHLYPPISICYTAIHLLIDEHCSMLACSLNSSLCEIYFRAINGLVNNNTEIIMKKKTLKRRSDERLVSIHFLWKKNALAACASVWKYTMAETLIVIECAIMNQLSARLKTKMHENNPSINSTASLHILATLDLPFFTNQLDIMCVYCFDAVRQFNRSISNTQKWFYTMKSFLIQYW